MLLSDWNSKRTSETVRPEEENSKDPQMQYRRDLSFIYQECAFQFHVPIYGVVSTERLLDEDIQNLEALLPGAKSAIILGSVVGDPIMNALFDYPGIRESTPVSSASSGVELQLFKFERKLALQGFTTASVILPPTPDERYLSLIAASGIGVAGRNRRILNATYGCRLQLGFIVTDAPLLHGDYRYEPQKEDLCGDCRLCEQYCPCGALDDGSYDAVLCHAYREAQEHQVHLDASIRLLCDECQRICPAGTKEHWDSKPVRWEELVETGEINR